MAPPQEPFATKVNDRVAGPPPAAKTPYVCGPLGAETPPEACKVATRLVVGADPVLIRPKLIVTVSPGSTAPLTQLSLVNARLFEARSGEGEPARLAMRASFG